MPPPLTYKPRFPRWKSSTLIQAALASRDEDRRWRYVVELHWRGDRATLDAATALCQDPSARKRCLGADILAQLGVPDRTFPGEALTTLLEMSRRETSTLVLQSILMALGHNLDATARAPWAFYKRVFPHKSATVRFALAYALMGREDPASIRMLIRLSQDLAARVRDWATFCLGTQTDVDTPALRRALLQRVADRHSETRGEALVGLARRNDARILPVLEPSLARSPSWLELEAAARLGDPRLLPRLLKLRARVQNDANTNRLWLSQLESAIQDLSRLA